jgi:hypothetical protein
VAARLPGGDAVTLRWSGGDRSKPRSWDRKISANVARPSLEMPPRACVDLDLGTDGRIGGWQTSGSY